MEDLIAEPNKRFIVYWHKAANSGLWYYDTFARAYQIAQELRKQDLVFTVTIIDTELSVNTKIKE